MYFRNVVSRGLVVRFFRVIGHPHHRTGPSCPILSGYRTTASSAGLRLSDSSGLSDIRIVSGALVVRFFWVIGHPHRQLGSGCPILSDYRTAASSVEHWLSDSFGLSDSRIIVRGLVVRFFRVIGQLPYRLLLRFFNQYFPYGSLNAFNKFRFG